MVAKWRKHNEHGSKQQLDNVHDGSCIVLFWCCTFTFGKLCRLQILWPVFLFEVAINSSRSYQRKRYVFRHGSFDELWRNESEMEIITFWETGLLEVCINNTVLGYGDGFWEQWNRCETSKHWTGEQLEGQKDCVYKYVYDIYLYNIYIYTHIYNIHIQYTYIIYI